MGYIVQYESTRDPPAPHHLIIIHPAGRHAAHPPHPHPVPAGEQLQHQANAQMA